MFGNGSFDASSMRLTLVQRARHRYGAVSILLFVAFAVFLVAVGIPRSEAAGVAQSSQRPLAQCEFGRGWTEISSGFDLAGSGFESPAYCPPVAMFWAANGWLPMWGYEANIENDYGKVLTQFPGGDACSPPGIETSVSYDFEVPCRMHDYCYSLRKAGLSGTISDDDCDVAFFYAMEAHCNDRVFPLSVDCRLNRDIYYSAVRLPSVVTDANPGLITLRNINSLLCADVPGSSTAFGTVLIQWTCNSTPNQKFRIWPAQGQPGFFEIQASHSGLCAFSSNAGVAEWPCGSSNPAGQFWIWSYNDSDLWTLRPRDGFSSRCWDVPGSSKLPGVQIGLWGCANTPNQLWQIRL